MACPVLSRGARFAERLHARVGELISSEALYVVRESQKTGSISASSLQVSRYSLRRLRISLDAWGPPDNVARRLGNRHLRCPGFTAWASHLARYVVLLYYMLCWWIMSKGKSAPIGLGSAQSSAGSPGSAIGLARISLAEVLATLC